MELTAAALPQMGALRVPAKRGGPLDPERLSVGEALFQLHDPCLNRIARQAARDEDHHLPQPGHAEAGGKGNIDHHQ